MRRVLRTATAPILEKFQPDGSALRFGKRRALQGQPPYRLTNSDRRTMVLERPAPSCFVGSVFADHCILYPESLLWGRGFFRHLFRLALTETIDIAISSGRWVLCRG